MNGNLITKKAQIFNLDGTFIPSKVSVYLRCTNLNNNKYFYLNQSRTVIDALNFLQIKDGTEKIILGNSISGYSGYGYLSHYVDFEFISPKIIYPIKKAGVYQIWIRVANPSSDITINIYLNDNFYNVITSSINSSFVWISSNIQLINDNVYYIGIQMIQNDTHIDQIIIQQVSYGTPSGSVDFSESSYITVINQFYELSSGIPSNPLDVFDYNSNVCINGWYNFDVNRKISSSTDLSSGDYANVLFASGANSKNTVFWDISKSVSGSPSAYE